VPLPLLSAPLLPSYAADAFHYAAAAIDAAPPLITLSYFISRRRQADAFAAAFTTPRYFRWSAACFFTFSLPISPATMPRRFDARRLR
jgi:hypothetical protein